MFLELVQGRAVSEAALRSAWEQVLATIAEEATGWIGATSGAAAHGGFVAILGFESEEAARISMGRLDESATWNPLEPLLADLRFRELPHVRAFGVAGLGDADLVEVTQGSANDVGRLLSVVEGSARAVLADEAPFLGTLVAWDDSAFAVNVLYRRASEGVVASTPDPVRQDAPILLDQSVQLDVVDPWSILVPAGLPPRDHGRPVLP